MLSWLVKSLRQKSYITCFRVLIENCQTIYKFVEIVNIFVDFQSGRFGWPAKFLIPLDGGAGRACRGDTETDNDDRVSEARSDDAGSGVF